MRKIILMTVFVSMAFVFSGAAFACCGMYPAGPGAKGGIINAACLVMGGKVDKDTPYKMECKDKTISFCCPGCIKEFKANSCFAQLPCCPPNEVSI